MKDDSGFLEDIVAHPDDPVPRLIYADWLEEQGDDVRGVFLRLEVKLKELKESTREHNRTRARLGELRKKISRDWLALLDRTDVENCGLEFTFKCPRRWEALTLTDDANVRFCDDCQKQVYHCLHIQDARALAGEGKCVAVDSRLTRSPGDIQPPVQMMTLGLVMPRIAEPEENEEDVDTRRNDRRARKHERKRQGRRLDGN